LRGGLGRSQRKRSGGGRRILAEEGAEGVSLSPGGLKVATSRKVLYL